VVAGLFSSTVIHFRPASVDDRDAIRHFLAENGWAERVADGERFVKMMENASRAIIAQDEGTIVGFARALCDDASNGYIGTVAVSEAMRGRGIGRELVQRLIGDDTNITWVLRAGRGSDGFWEKMGFRRSQAAMERTRK
jgi:N-acetylglutamate synthase-like GNAT family acetyltransferase